MPGWSRNAIDLSDLRLGAGTLTMQATRLQIDDVTLGPGAWTADLQEGVLKLTLTDGQGFGGRLNLSLTIDTNAAELRAVGNLKGQGLAAGQVAEAVGAAKGSVSGRLDLDLSLRSRGASVAGLVAALNGRVDAAVADGQLRGVDLGTLLRATSRTVQGLPGGSTSVGKAHLKGDIRKDVLQVKDGRFVVVPLTVQVSGNVGLANRTVALSLDPKVDPSLGVLNVPISVLVPVAVSGSWHKPVFRPELEKLATRPLQIACDVLSKAGGPVDEACDGVIGAANAVVGGGAKAIGQGVEAVGGGIKKGIECLGALFSKKDC